MAKNSFHGVLTSKILHTWQITSPNAIILLCRRAVVNLQANNTLITDDQHARDVGEWMRTNLNRLQNLSTDWRVDPAIDVGDIVQVISEATDTRPEQTYAMRVLSNSFSFTGAFKGKSDGEVMT